MLVTALAAEGTTIVLTTHYLDEAEALANRVAVIVGARIVAQDTPAGLGGRASAEATVHWVDSGGPHDVRTATPTGLIAQLSAALGVAGCTLLGIAASGIARTARSTPAVLNLIFLVLEFMSGVFIVPITTLPRWMVDIASFFPLKWTAQGMRSVFLPDGMMSMEGAETWEHAMTAVALGGWCVAGLMLCLATFRWSNRDDR
jgi:hypothetical protein